MDVNHKKIAKNTLYMYLRLMITIPLAFYTSRVVLQQLGVDDFGIYQAVGGIVSLFALLRGAFDSATQRYYNVALAKKEDGLLSQMFTTSLIIHLFVAIILTIAIELFGIWFIGHKMAYPEGSQSDVYFVFHTMVVSIAFIILEIPFSGMIIAQEHIKFNAYLSIIDVILKLGLVFLLIFISAEKLRIYAIFQMSVSIVLFLMNTIYVSLNFKDVRLVKFSRTICYKMASFSGWGLLGNICYSLVHEGVNLLLNVYGGVVANAARGIAFQVRGVIGSILTNTFVPVRPQATQLYVTEDYMEFWNLIYQYSKILFILSSLMVIPICIFAEHIIKLWLGSIPEYSCVFLQILMIYTLIRSFHEPFDLVFKASGRMKVYQLTTVCISSMTFFLGWLFLYKGFAIYTPFIIFCIVEFILLMALLFTAKNEGVSISKYLKSVLLPCIIYSVISFGISYLISKIFNNWIIALVVTLIIIPIISYYVGLNRNERHLVKSKIFDRLFVR